MQFWTSVFFAVVSFIGSQIQFTNNFVELTQTQSAASPFIAVAGNDFKSRYEQAVQTGRRTQPKFWVAYRFDVRPGVTVDAEFINGNNLTIVNGVAKNADVETRNLGVFLLHDANAVTRLEIYNLERKREYSNYPVYWLERANNAESLQFLQSFVDTPQADRINESAVSAIALHDDKTVAALLKNFVQNSTNVKVRKSALFWHGEQTFEPEFLAALIRNEQENIEVRKQAAFVIGHNNDAGALPLLQNLYGAVTPRELKRQLIFAASLQANQEGAVDFLMRLAESEPERELKKQALFWLGQKAGARSLKFLTDVAQKNDGETEVQKQAVFAISQKPKDEAIPTLLKIARTHANVAVRKQAIFWLGQSGDERAVAYFKEVLEK